jgi:hypothetical protein
MTPDTIAGRSGRWEVAGSNPVQILPAPTTIKQDLVELNSVGTNSGWVDGWADRRALAGAAGKAR